jgi:hypothetical protein
VVLLLVGLAAGLGYAALSPRMGASPGESVLFVGNSLTYVGNTPAIYSALAAANGKHAPSDMIVRGGARLAQRVADGSVANALASGRYRHLVIQERGGDLVGGFGTQAEEESRVAIQALGELGRKHGVQVHMLGSYQPASGSRHLVDAESAAAGAAGVQYIEISETLQTLMQTHPGMHWFPPGDFHPGKDLALLNAVRVHQAIHGTLPAAESLAVQAPIYASTSGLDEVLRPSDAPAPLAATPGSIAYPAESLAVLVSQLEEAP